MGSYNTQTIKVPMQVQVQVQNSVEEMRRLRTSMEDQFKKVDVTSGLGKQLAKLKAKLDKGFANIDASNLGSDLFDESDFKKVLGFITQINNGLQEMRVAGSSASAATLGLDVSAIEDARKALADLTAEYNKYKKQTVGSHNPTQLQTFEAHKKDTGFNARASYATNISKLTTQKNILEAQQAELNTDEAKAARAKAQADLDAATKTADAAREKYEKAQQATADAAKEVQRQEELLAQHKVADRIGKITGTTKGRDKNAVIEDYKAKIATIARKDGNFVSGGREMARVVAGWLDMSDNEIEVLLQQKASEVVTQLQAKLSTSMAANMGTFTKKVKSAQTGYDSQAHLDATNAHTKAQQDELQAEVARTTEQTKEAAAQAAYKEAFDMYNRTEALLKVIEEQLTQLKDLAKQLEESADEKYGDRIQAAKDAIKKAEQDTTRDTRDALERDAKEAAGHVKQQQQGYSDTRKGNQDKVEAERRAKEAAAKARQEAETFKSNMQAAIKQWISAQVIINKIKDGVRQAITDIKGLDSAMTNIAVVTDMSVSDLWGRINEYMSIAQQYGVSTQGVYEVSQLYYQQGLSASEVMAATTETLKMARIAGMGYAEAADAMTVAIRAFKMEMSDAGHITDVYSKVAAVTASDTEELATAMSKTASSAESVGSSFENTTAMLAVMIETTRESAQNLGSALKSIISRYGEMKVGVTVDKDGETIDYNKVDTALKSVGISIKDAQGQFRDFDDVIFELSKKWDSLDKNTQRYIATIMAGNRQQSRFIALVDNWERLDEVATAAQNSEDAGLLQYAKTLDSLETKMNNIKTSFQQFYMNIFNGEAFGTILETINNLIKGLNQLGSLQGIFNVASLIAGLRTGLSLIGNLFSNMFGGIITNWRKAQEQMVAEAYSYGYKTAKAKQQGEEAAEQGEQLQEMFDDDTPGPGASTRWGKNQSYSFGVRNKDSGRWGKHFQYKTEGGATAGKITGAVASIAGTALTSAGTAIAANNPRAGAWMSAGGNALQGLSMGAAFGPWGMAIGTALGALSGLPGIIKAMDDNNQRQFEYGQAKKKAEEANIERAETKDEYNTLKDLLNKYDTVKDNRFNSEEDYQAWISLNSQLAEAYPELISYIDAEGNAIVDVTNATKVLESAMGKASKASENYYRLKQAEYEAQIGMNKDHTYSSDTIFDYEATAKTYKKLGLIDQGETKHVVGYTYGGAASPNTPVHGYNLNRAGRLAHDDSQNYIGSGPAKWTAGGLIDAWEALGLKPEQLLYAAMGGKSSSTYRGLSSTGQAWVDYLLDSDGLNKKVFAKDKEGRITGWETHLENVLAGKTGQKELAVNASEAYQSAVYWQSEYSSADDAFSNLTGATAIITKHLQASGYTLAEQIDTSAMSTEKFDEAIKGLTDVYAGLSSSKRTKLSGLYDQLSEISYGALEKEFGNYGGADESNPLWNAYESLWYDQNYNKAYRYGSALRSEDSPSLMTYEDYLKTIKGEDNTTNRKNYYKGTLLTLDQEVQNLIDNHTSDVIEQYIDIVQSSKEIPENGSYGEKIAKARATYISSIINSLNDDGSYDNLTIPETTEFLDLLTAENAGSQKWADSITKFAQQHNLQLADLNQYVFENFNTELQTILDSSKTTIKTYDEYASKQQSGFTAAEAQKIVQQLGGENALITDYFTTTKEGLLVMSDFDRTIGQLYSQRNVDIHKLKNSIQSALQTIGNVDNKQAFDSLFNLQEEYQFEELDIENYLQRQGIDAELSATLAGLIASNEIKTTEDLSAWLNAYVKNLGIVIDTETNSILDLLKADAKRQKVIDLQNSAKAAGVNYDKISAYSSFASKGLTGYSAKEIAPLASAFGWEEGQHFTLDTATGTYNIKSDILSNTEFMNSVPMEYRNQLLSLINQETTSALDAIKQLGASVAAGDKGVYGKAFDKTLGYNVAETLIPQWVKAAHEGRTVGSENAPQDPAQLLKEQIAAELSAESGTTIKATDTIVIQKYNELMNGYADGLDGNLVKFLELKEKELFGTISDTEQNTLNNLNLDGTLEEELTNILNQAGSTTVDKYTTMMKAALASGADWAKIEKYVSNGYKAKFAKLFSGFDVTDLDTYKSIDTIEGAAGQYTEEMLTSIATQLTAEAKAKGENETDITAAMTAFENAFDYNTKTGVAKLKSGNSWSTVFAQFLNEDGSVPEWLQPFINAFNASEATEAMNDSVRAADLPGKINKTISSMLSNYADITLESFISFYDDIFGPGAYQALDDTTKANYLTAIQKAQKGNLSDLKTQIDSIAAKAASEKNIQIDTTAVTNAYNDATSAINSQFLEYQLKAIQGTITGTERSWLDGLTFSEDDWQKDLVDELAAEGIDTITQYSAIIKAAIDSKLPWNQVSSMVQNAYATQLELLANAEADTNISQADTYNAILGIKEANGYYGKDALSQLFNQMGAEGYAIDTAKVKDYFDYDKVTKAWVLKQGQNIDDALAALFGSTEIVPAEVKAAFAASQDNKGANDLIRADTLKRETERTIISMMGNLTNVSLSEIESLYESVYNVEIPKEKVTEAVEAINQAKLGNYTALITFLESLAAAANVDTSENSAISAAKTDSAVTRRVKYLALMKKQAEGILTDTEAVELSNLSTALKGEGQSWVAPLEQAFQDNTNKVAADYDSALATAVNDAGVDIQSVEQYATEAFQTALDKKLYGYAVKDKDTYKANKTIGDSAGLFDTEAINSWLTQMQAETVGVMAGDQAIDLSNFTNYLGTLFTPDNKGNLIWGGGDIDLNTLLKGYFGDDNPAVAILEPILTPFFNSLTKSNKSKAVNDKIDLDNLQDTVNSTVKSLFTNATDASLEQIVNLYDSIKGQGAFSNLDSTEQAKYQTALADAAKGNLKALYDLITQLVGSNPDLDTSGIQSAYTDANATINKQFLDYSIKSITGSLTAAEESWLNNFVLDDTDGWQKDLTTSMKAEGATITSKYAAAIKGAIGSDLPWDQIQSYVSDAYKYQLSYLATNLNFKDLNTHQAISGIEDAAGYYSEDVLSSMFTQITRETDAVVDLSTFAAYFQYDKQTETWVKRVGTDISAFYQAVTGVAIPEWLKDAFDASEAQRIVDTARNNESKGKSITGTIEGLIKDASGVTLESLISLYEDINGKGSFKDSGMLTAYSLAIKQAEAGNVDLLRSQLKTLVDSARAKGYDIDTSALNAAYEDAIYSLIEGLTSAIKKGIEGTLSASEYDSLMQQYGLSGKATKTANGLQLNAADQRKLIAKMYNQASLNGSTQGIGKQIWDSFGNDSKTLLGTYDSVTNEIKYITSQIEKFGDDPGMAKQRKEAEAYLAVLRQIEEAAYLDPNNSIFNFMDQKATDGYTDGFDNYVASIDKVKTAFASLQQKGGYITYNDFYNMMDFLNTSKQWDSFAEKTNLAGKKYEDFVNSVVANTDKWGHVNIKGIAAEMGISVEAATKAMGDSMTEGLKTVAKQQIKYLSGLETMLKAFIALEGLGNLKLSLDITTSLKDENGNPYKITHLSEIADRWNELDSGDREKVLEQANTVVRTASNSKEGKQLMDSFRAAFGLGKGFEGMTLMDLFFGGEITKDNVGLADAFGTLQQELPNLTEGQMETIATSMKAAFGNLLGENGEFLGTKEQWQSTIQNFFKNLNFDAIPETINSKVSAAAASTEVTEIVAGKAKLVFGENGITFEGEDLDANKQALIQQLQSQLNVAVGDIQLGENGEVHLIPPSTTTETKALTADFESIEDAAEGVIIAMNTLQGILDAFQVSEQFREFASLVSSMYGNPEVTDGSADMGMQVAIDTSDALAAVTDFQSSFDTMKSAIENNPIIIRAQGSSLNGTNVQTQTQTQAGTQTSTETVTKVSQIISVTYETTNEEPTVTTPQEIIYNWKQGLAISTPKDKSVSFTWKDTNPLNNWYTSTNPVTVNFKWQQTGNAPTPPSGGSEAWTGTINNISGRALADGSIGRMYSGAELAQKTLVGELGPELAVYDGEYHMLGANGAEFVNLPSDAIVFNHLQTAGIMKGQMNVRGTAMADGNVHGPALAGGASAALAQVTRAKAVWQGLLKSLSVADLLGGSGGGGGNTLKAVKEELQEWYNLSRQIANIEQEINNLLAERANIPERDGDAYLRSLRKEQELLEQQAATQEILLGYQKLQLERQAEQINTNKIWSQFLEVDENGLLQYTKGNELFGGKGALEVLSDLNEMSGEEQLKFLKDLGYTAKDQDGEELKDQELIKKFYEELQLQIDEYDQLYDTIHETSETLEKLQTKVEEINSEITKNQMDLEKDIFDILVDAWEEEIDALEEQKDLIEEANDTYVKGLNEALSAEREMYSEEQSIADREQLQRQLSLLRRSGGSASQIADLEQQLDSMLKDEYFRNQEQVIERIEDANEEQIRQLERQIKLQEEALEFEKEHGILWTKVYDIMAGSADQILNFMQGKSLEFFSQSLLQQEKMLTDWAKKIGIYTENKKYEGYEQDIQQSAWDSGDIWSYGAMSGYKSTYDSMTAEQQAAARKMFNTTYANARLSGDDHNTAMAKAQNALINNFKSYKEQQAASGNKPETDLITGSGSETWYVTGPNKLNLRDQPSKSGNRLAQLPAGTKVKVLKKLDNGWFQVEVDGKTGYVDSQFLSKGTSSSNSNESSSNSNTSNSSSSGYRYKVTYSGTMSDGETDKPVSGSGMGNSEYEAKAVAKRYADAKVTGNWVWLNGGPTYRTIKLYSEGGLVDYTGPAIVHGTRSKPEAFLNAKQTAMISEAVKVAGDGGALDGIKTTLNKLDATIKSIVNNNKNETTSFTVAPGAVTIQVAQLNDSYDVEELSKDVMNRMVAIASKSTNRGVNRR